MQMKIELHEGPLKIVIVKNGADVSAQKVEQLQLTLSEFRILKELITNEGCHLSKEHLLKSGWPNSYVCNNALNMVIMSLRKKLNKTDVLFEINTIYRFGYSLNMTMIIS